eukprot:TRINITY_DN46505_c0_g1_i1.p1 TRINITY_DN46505_c0_g1~~TRINITY_DN46505_c0_g1_i1.p1  ORF type:complete len:207 (-),score=45.13 TRINITY_DN46505_c0_g1_i1:374-994(-)
MLCFQRGALRLSRQQPPATLLPFRQFSAVAPTVDATAAVAETGRGYARTLCLWHWLMGFSVLGTLGTVKVAQNLDSKHPMKGELMKLHKSLALVSVGMLIPRLGLRLMTKQPNPAALHSKLSHFLMYGFMMSMPTSGIAMGYFGGKGIPFFDFYHVPGAPDDKKDSEIAKNAFKAHKMVGQAMVMWVCLHIGVGIGGGMTRVNPFA